MSRRFSPAGAASVAPRLLRWFDQAGRHDLPWQHPRSPYRAWLSEVMLQQTQVRTVIPYFERFVQRFPDVETLAAAPLDDVLALWSGLGYYARARNLHRAAKQIVTVHGGRFPQDFEAVAALPGIGRSTAAAILSQAFGQRHAILDGNVRRVLARWAGVEGWPGSAAVQSHLWAVAEALLPQRRLADYTQALMDLGAMVCTARRPACAACPLRGDCEALRQDRVSALPSPRPRRERPSRQAAVLLAQNDQGAILLERRPPSGIWGGLWCPPILEEGMRWEEGLRRLGFASAPSGEALAPLRHGFTHFELLLQPHHVRGLATQDLQDANRAWVTLPQARTLGLPAPIRRLLNHPRLQTCREPSTA